MDLSQSPSPFLRLPPELRLIIYELLLIHPTIEAKGGRKSSPSMYTSSAPEYLDYEVQSSTNKSPTPPLTLRIRTEDPAHFARRQLTATTTATPPETRSRFLVRSDRFRARCMWTTYHLMGVGSSNKSGGGMLSPALLLANARIHAECVRLLYSSYCFDFDTCIEAIVPFLADLTPFARSCIQSIRVVKRALPYQKCFDDAEWAAATDYISQNLALKSLSVGIVAGKPAAPGGWDYLPPYSAAELAYMCETDGIMEWVPDLVRIRGLERLEVDAVVEHCPLPMSKAMAQYVRFSASVESTFASFLREQMVR